MNTDFDFARETSAICQSLLPCESAHQTINDVEYHGRISDDGLSYVACCPVEAPCHRRHFPRTGVAAAGLARLARAFGRPNAPVTRAEAEAYVGRAFVDALIAERYLAARSMIGRSPAMEPLARSREMLGLQRETVAA